MIHWSIKAGMSHNNGINGINGPVQKQLLCPFL